MQTTPHVWRRLFASLLILSCGLLAIPAASAAESPKRQFDLPADSAEKTLKAFSAQAGVEVLFSSDAAVGVRTKAVKGEYTPMEAVKQMLAGTPLYVRDEKDGVVRIARDVDPNAGRAAAEGGDRQAEALARVARQGGTAQPASMKESDDEPVVLSPFVVSASEDQNTYRASSTLAGTRIRTELKDVGSSVQVVTQKFLQDTNSKNMEDLLVYTTGTEVAGQGGNFLGQGDGGALTGQNVSRPVANTRVRGLASADNTRDFFLTDIPWDSYNVGRVDLQRGPNAILFGIGSPAGIVNTSLNPASFKNSNKIENQVGSYGTVRYTADFNRVLLKNEFALRISLLNDSTKYRQNPAFKDDRRVYAAMRYDPTFLNLGSAHTSLTANFETGNQRRNDPLDTPPIDAITPWFSAYSATQRAQGFSAADPATYNDPAKYGVALKSLANMSVSDPWLGRAGGRVFDGVVTTFDGGSPGFTYSSSLASWPDNTKGAASVLGYNNLVGMNSYATYATNSKLIGYSINAFKTASLTDPSIFDFYNNLLAGPNNSQFNQFHASNVALQQTFFGDKLGFELAYNKQYAQFGNTTLITAGATMIALDVMRTLIDGTLNPNFLRPVIYASGGSAGGEWQKRDRENQRLTAFGELNFADFSGKDSWLARIFGRNVFTGLLSKQKNEASQAGYSRYYIADSFAPNASVAGVGQATRDDMLAIYLGAAVTGSSASGVGIEGIKAKISPPTSQTIHYYNNVTQAWEWIPLAIVNNDLSPDELKTYVSARKSRDTVTSRAIVWQGYWLGGSVIPMVGLRTDKDSFLDAGNPPAVKSNPYGKGGLVNPYDPSWDLPGTGVGNTVRSKTYSVVTHLPSSWRNKMPGNLDISLIYDKSENFNPDSSRRDIMGSPVASPQGKTEEHGVAVSLLNDKVTLKWMRYKTSVANATLSGSIGYQYAIGAMEAWGQLAAYNFRASLSPGGPLNWPADTLYGYSSDGHQVTWRPDGPLQSTYTQAQLDATYAHEKASVEAWFTQQVPAAFQEAWALTDYATGGGSTNYGANGLVVTGDTLSKGDEFELMVNPIAGLNLVVNASKTFASRQNLAKSYTDWLAFRSNQLWTSASGDMRLWDGLDDSMGGETVGGDYGKQIMAGYNLFKALEGTAVPELRPWRFSVIGNYDFHQQLLKGFNVGASYRWQQATTTGFPVVGGGTATDPYRYDINRPYKGRNEGIADVWVGYQRKLAWRNIKWRIQLNVRNLLADDKLIVTTVQPDGSPAGYRIPEPRTWTLTNTFEF